MGPHSLARRSRERAAVGERLARLFGPASAPESGDTLGFGVEDPSGAARGFAQRLTPMAVAAIALVAALGVAWAAWLALRSVPHGESESPGPIPIQTRGVVATPGASAASSGSPAVGGAFVVVHVAGRVRRPGLVRLPPGSRVADALAAAGGVLAGVDLTTINLARVLTDGEQVLVGVTGPGGTAAGPGLGSGGGGAGGGGAGGLVDLNTATLEQLEGLPGVGPVLAQRILDFRSSHGRFATVDELREVSGIGERKYADIEPKVRAG